MYNLIIRGFNTKAEVEAFSDWYGGQGEQDAYIWFECRKDEGEIDVKSMNVDSSKNVGWANETDYEFSVKPR